jgi:hypothetical protein
VIYQRYSDADLAPVGEEVSLEHTYGEAGWSWWVKSAVAAGAVFALVLLGVFVRLLVGAPRRAAATGLPADLSPFVAAGLLREIRERPELTPAQRAALDQDLAALEQYYFAADRNGHPPPDVPALVGKWVAAAPGWSAATVRTEPATAG